MIFSKGDYLVLNLPEKQKLIYNVAKTIAETDMNEE